MKYWCKSYIIFKYWCKSLGPSENVHWYLDEDLFFFSSISTLGSDLFEYPILASCMFRCNTPAHFACVFFFFFFWLKLVFISSGTRLTTLVSSNLWHQPVCTDSSLLKPGLSLLADLAARHYSESVTLCKLISCPFTPLNSVEALCLPVLSPCRWR